MLKNYEPLSGVEPGSFRIVVQYSSTALASPGKMLYVLTSICVLGNQYTGQNILFHFLKKALKNSKNGEKLGENKCLLSSFPNIGRHRNASLAPLKTVIVFTRCFFIEVQEGLIFCPKMVLAGLQVLQ